MKNKKKELRILNGLWLLCGLVLGIIVSKILKRRKKIKVWRFKVEDDSIYIISDEGKIKTFVEKIPKN